MDIGQDALDPPRDTWTHDEHFCIHQRIALAVRHGAGEPPCRGRSLGGGGRHAHEHRQQHARAEPMRTNLNDRLAHALILPRLHEVQADYCSTWNVDDAGVNDCLLTLSVTFTSRVYCPG